MLGTVKALWLVVLVACGAPRLPDASWVTSVESPSAIAEVHGDVAVLSRIGPSEVQLVRCDGRTGSTLWRRTLNLSGAATLANDADGGLIVVDDMTNTGLNVSVVDDEGHDTPLAAPALAGRLFRYAVQRGYLIVATGSAMASVSLYRLNDTQPLWTMTDGTLYTDVPFVGVHSSGAAFVYGYDGARMEQRLVMVSATGEKRWSIGNLPGAALTFSTDGGLLVATGDHVAAYSPDGEALWSTPFSTNAGAHPLLATDTSAYHFRGADFDAADEDNDAVIAGYDLATGSLAREIAFYDNPGPFAVSGSSLFATSYEIVFAIPL